MTKTAIVGAASRSRVETIGPSSARDRSEAEEGLDCEELTKSTVKQRNGS
jgi:hypothetical protein